MTSVNTNSSATTALRTLQATNKSLEATQNRVSTGLKINEAKDNAAYWAISTTLQSDNKSLSTVKDALGLGAATVDTAYQGLNKAKEVLDEIQKKLTAATQDGVDRNIIQSEIKQLQDQLTSIASSSTFSGENWLSVDSSASDYNSLKSIVSSFSRDPNNAITIGTIGVDVSTVALFDSSATGTGILDGSANLKKADGTLLTVGGVNATGSAPALQGTDTVVSTAGTAVANATAAVAGVGTLNLAGLDVNDKITFNLAVDGGAAQTVTFGLGSVTNATNFTSGLQSAINAAVGSGKITVATNVTTNAITFTSATTGSSSSVAVTSLAAVDGDGTVTSTLGLAATAVPAYGTGAAATGSIGTFAAANITNSIADGDKITYRVEYDGDIYQGSYTFTNTGYVAPATPTAAEFAANLTTSFALATKISDGTALGANKVTVTNAVNALSINTVGTGTSKSVSLIQTTAVEGTGGTAIAATKLGLTDAASTFVGTGTVATYSLGTFSNTGVDAGDRVRLDLSVASDATGSVVATRQTVNISTAGLLGGGGNLAADRAQFVINAQAAVNSAFGAGKVTVSDNAGAIEFKTVRTGVNESLTFHNIQGIDGDGAATSSLGLANASLVSGTAATTATAASALSGSAFAGPVTFDAQDELTFNVAVDGAAAKKVTINKAVIDAALGGTAGTITTPANFVTVVNAALTNAGLNTSITASVDGANKLKLDKLTTGVGSIAVTGAASTTGADSISVSTIDISDTALASLGVDGTNRKDVLSAYISVVKDAITKITSKAADLGSVSSRVELQQTFVDTLMDTIDKGVGNLIDADLSEESTRLQALQTKQQLGVQALSIANSSTQNILRLFQSN